MESEGSLTRIAHELYVPDPARREEAARQLWLRFSQRLETLIRRRLDARIFRRLGADDVLQSVFGSFFAAGPGPHGPARDRAELWRRLVHFTMCKVANTADYHRARRRDVRREAPMADGESDAGRVAFEPVDVRGLGAEDEVIARSEFERLFAALPDELRQIFAMRLEGYTNRQVAESIGRSERLVELKLQMIRGLLRPHLKDLMPPSPVDSTPRSP